MLNSKSLAQTRLPDGGQVAGRPDLQGLIFLASVSEILQGQQLVPNHFAPGRA